MLDNTEEVSSTQNGFFRNPSQPLKQTRGTCSRQPQRKQQWTARSMVGVYTDEEDEEEGDMEEDDDDDDGDGEVSTEDQRTDNEQYKEAREQLDELKQQNGDAKAMTSSACAERANLLPSATKCQSNSDVNLSTQKGTNMASVQHHKQHHIESSRSTLAQNVTRKTSLSDHQPPPQQLSAQIAAGATTAINGMAPVVNKLSAQAQLKKRPYNPIGAAVTFEDECNDGTLLNGHSTTEAQNANNGQQEANNANANGQQEANNAINGQQEANNANAINGQQEANHANAINGQQEANNANVNNGQQEANNANSTGQHKANNANANNGKHEANNDNSNGQNEANNANVINGQQEANNANVINGQQEANNANSNGQHEANNANANNGQQEANNANANGQQEANNANASGQHETNNANANNEQQQQQMGIQQISKNNEGNNNMPAMEEAKARQSVDQTVFDTDIRRTARTRCDSV